MKWRWFFSLGMITIEFVHKCQKVLALFDLVLLINGFYAIFDTWNEEWNTKKMTRYENEYAHTRALNLRKCGRLQGIGATDFVFFLSWVVYFCTDDGTGFFLGMLLHVVVAMRDVIS